MARFCGKCGAKLNEATGLCPNCDENNKEQAFNPEKATLSTQEQDTTPEPKKTISKKEAKKQRRLDKKVAKKEKWRGLSFVQKVRKIIIMLLLCLICGTILIGGVVYGLSYLNVISVPFITAVQNGTQIRAVVQDYLKYDELHAQTSTIAQKYVDEKGYVASHEVPDLLLEVNEYAISLYQKGIITDYAYKDGDSCVYMQIDGWLGYLYSPAVENTLQGGNDQKIEIITYEPFAYEFKSAWPYLIKGSQSYIMGKVEGVDNAAKKIVSSFGGEFSVSGSYDNADVSIATLTNMKSNSIIMWNGHGGYNERFGSILSLGSSKKHGNRIIDNILVNDLLFKDGSLLIINDHCCVTPIYFQSHMDDDVLNGSLVYLNACYSAADTRLFRSLLDKGSRCVVGNSSEVWLPYGVAMIYDFFVGLTKQSGDGSYYTVSEALAFAKLEEGARDPYKGGEVRAAYRDDFTLIDMYTHSSEEKAEFEEEVYVKYDEACKKTVQSGSWTEYLTLNANMNLSNSSEKLKTVVELYSTTDVYDYSENDISKVKMDGSATMKIAEQISEWNMKYRDGVAHYDYVKPSVSSADVEIDPGYFQFNTITEYMMVDAKVSGNTMTFKIPRDRMVEVSIGAKDLLSGISNLQYGDAGVTVKMNSQTGSIDSIHMTFRATMTYQGYDAEVDYEMDYHFSVRAKAPADQNAEVEQTIPAGAGVFNGHHYYVYNEGAITDWNAAQAFCESKGGHLATITDAEEDAFVYAYMIKSGYRSAMFGLTDQEKDDEWKWSTGEAFAYQNWHPGEPSHQGGYEHFGGYYEKFYDGTWNDGSGKGGPFICEWDKNAGKD